MEFYYILLNLIYVFFLFFCLFVIQRGNSERELREHENDPKISIIIPLHNEADQLFRLFKALERLLIAEDNLDIHLVDDNSDDQSYEHLSTFQNSSSFTKKIFCHRIKDQRPSKKKAIAKILNKINSDWIVQTDADCSFDTQWLHSIKSRISNDTLLLAGPVVFSGKSLLARLLEIESWALNAIAAFSFKIGKPQYCSAANLAWHKSVLQAGAYEDFIQMEIPSGDDSFLLNHIRDKFPGTYAYNWNPSSIVSTDSPSNFSSFINQRKRWTSKWNSMRNWDQILFPLLIWSYHLLLIIFSVSLLISGKYLFFLTVFTFKALFEYIFLSVVSGHFHKSVNIFYFLILQLFYSPYVVIFGLLGQFSAKKWK